MKDFFTRYRESRKHPYILPAIFGILFGFAIVAQITGTTIDLQSIQANVLEASSQKIQYNADLILERSSEKNILRIGKDATNVKSLSFSIVGNPEELSWVTISQKDTTIISNTPGVFLIQIPLNRSLKAGEVITEIRLNTQWNDSIVLIDGEFISGDSTYSLSTRIE